MHNRLATTVVGTVALFVLAVGCRDTTAGAPISGTTTETGGQTQTESSGNSPDRNGAPKVEDPLDATNYVAQPCSAVSAQLLPGLGLPAQGKQDTDSAVAKAGAPSCGWQNSETATGVTVAFLTKFKNGLADWYAAHERGDVGGGYWEETTVDDYPAVFADSTDNRPQGHCVLYLGVSETLMASIQSLGRLKERSCDHAKQVAAAVVQTMKGDA